MCWEEGVEECFVVWTPPRFEDVVLVCPLSLLSMCGENSRQACAVAVEYVYIPLC